MQDLRLDRLSGSAGRSIPRTCDVNDAWLTRDGEGRARPVSPVFRSDRTPA